jgi:HAD superfamily hydrolase (TIGR01459 family)
MKPIDGLRGVISRYRTLLVDVYGVLHDGGDIFPHAAEALREAKRHGAKVIVLTNSTLRAGAVAERLAQGGLGSECFDHVVSSGELTWRYLDAFAGGRLPRLRLLEDGPWPAWVGTLRNPIVDHARDADAVVAIRVLFLDDAGYAHTGIGDELNVAKRRSLPMIVADSDETFPYHGSIRLGPGWLARRYREVGGETVEFGKPHAPVYREAMRLAGDPDPASVLMVGDNLLTDIAGARAAGMDSLLVVRHGVHGDLSLDEIERQGRSLGTLPTWVAPCLRWAP